METGREPGGEQLLEVGPPAVSAQFGGEAQAQVGIPSSERALPEALPWDAVPPVTVTVVVYRGAKESPSKSFSADRSGGWDGSVIERTSVCGVSDHWLTDERPVV
ncbi:MULTISPECIES: hypothetical protein [Streptomyces]|uniref:Uncharacterized protein n=1 Tax=Streptomyces sp. 900129855 TaxID=3155129 RepID=A0ABV2ZH53_9ACTN